MAKMKDSRVAWIIGGGIVLGALIGGVAYASSKSSAGGGGANPPPPGVTPISFPAVLKKGRRYGVQATGPIGTLASLPGSVALLQAAIDSGQPAVGGVVFPQGAVKVISVSPSPDGSKWAAIFDVLGSDITVPPVPVATQAQAQQVGVSIVVSDIGAAGSP